MRRITLFIGLPDGEVFAKHLTRDLTRDPTRTPPFITSYALLRTIQMVRCLVRCLVRCWANTSPSETRMDKGFWGVLVRCQAFFHNLFISSSVLPFVSGTKRHTKIAATTQSTP